MNSWSIEKRWGSGLPLFLRRRSAVVPGVVILAGCVLAGCQPTVKIEAPDRPIEINLNVKIEHEIRVKVDRDLDDLLASNPELF
ncbi:MAG: hypothetical protein COA62_15355 [Rhodobiaceae bacterium]|nr:MAG: hypothetical protein COA62_15355 [Rhodobiaceae bacterium]